LPILYGLPYYESDVGNLLPSMNTTPLRPMYILF